VEFVILLSFHRFLYMKDVLPAYTIIINRKKKSFTIYNKNY